MNQHRIVIVGGALAGPTAAARAREVDQSAHITLLERAPNVSYAIGGLAYHLSGEVADVASLDRQRASFFRENYDVEVRTGVEVLGIDARTRVVKTNGGELEWDALVVCTGAKSTIPDVPGLADATNVLPFRNLVHLKAIVRELARGKRALVIGGGHFGIEAADGLARRGADVVLLEAGPRILGSFAPGASFAARVGLSARGVDVRTGVGIASATRRGARVTALVTSTGESIPCDLVIVAAGVRPRTGLLAGAGARLLPSGAVRIDEHCQTSLSDVFACGSCVAVRHAVSDDLVWLPQASIVDKTAQVAGACAAGRDAELGAMVGTMILRAGDAVVARTGLAQDALGRAEIARVHPLSHDAYFPGAAPLSIELAFDPRDGRVLAADAWGSVGVDKRIDVLATAISAGLTVADVAALDLAYEAGFSSSRDPVNVAAAVAYETAHEPGLVWAPEEIVGREGVALVDVRSVEERAAGAGIAGARKSSLAAVRTGDGEPADAGGPIVFVSSDGRAGYLAARFARARGVADAGFLSGGLRSWVASGLPLEAPPPRTKPKKRAAKKGGARRRA